MTAAEYSNLLEQQFSRLPGLLQSVLRDPFDWVDSVLKDIAGHPDQLVAAGHVYATLGRQVQQLGAEQERDRLVILNGAFSGPAYDAFSARMAEVEQRIAALGQATGRTQQMLDAAAQACAQSATMIVDIVEGVISFILQDAIVSGLVSLFTLGAAAAAGVAAAVEKFATACEEVGGVVAKLSSVLEKIAELLRELNTACDRVVKYLVQLQQTLKALKENKPFLERQVAGAAWQRRGITGAVRAVVGYSLVGSPIPGLGGGAVHAGISGVQAGIDVNNANKK